MVDINHLASQRGHQKTEGQYDNDEHQQGHDHGRGDFPISYDTLKFLEKGIKDHGQENSPYDGREKRREDFVKEINGKESKKKDEEEKNMFPFHVLP
jgi:hypothetical protein